MIESIITSKTRVKLLLKFFLNSNTKSYLRNLEQEFGESSNAIRVELNRLEEAGLLQSEVAGKIKYYSANTRHPLFFDINNIIKKIVGIDQVVERVVNNIGNLQKAFVTGDIARGIDSKIIELLLIGDNLDTAYIDHLIEKAEKLLDRKIRYLIVTADQMSGYFKNTPSLLIWETNH